jgi:thiol:disulfide interchange protein DsbC
MLKSIIVFIALFLCFCFSDALAFQTKGQNCLKCHTLKKDEATVLLNNFSPGIKVLNVSQSQAKYLWEISYESGGKKGILYIDLPKKHVFSGSLITVQGRKNLTKEHLSDINRINVSQIPLKDALVIGDRSAQKRVIVFNDPD